MLHGHKELSYDRQGYIYWRGVCVEHFNDPSRQVAHAREIAAACRHLERIGVPVSLSTTVYYRGWFDAMAADHPYKDVLVPLTCAWEVNPTTSEIAFVGVRQRCYDIVYRDPTGRWRHAKDPWAKDDDRLVGPWQYHGLRRAGFEAAGLGQRFWASTSDAPLSGVVSWLERHGFTPEVLASVLDLEAPVESEMIVPRHYVAGIYGAAPLPPDVVARYRAGVGMRPSRTPGKGVSCGLMMRPTVDG